MVRCALLVLDPQRDFFEPDNPNAAEFNAAVGVINQATRMFRAGGLSVVIALHTSAAKSAGSWQHGVWEGVDVRPTDVRLNKTTVDAFWQSGLDDHLQDRTVERVVVSGFLSDHCVLGTYFGARARGYDACLVKDGTAALELGLRSYVEAVVRTADLGHLPAELESPDP